MEFLTFRSRVLGIGIGCSGNSSETHADSVPPVNRVNSHGLIDNGSAAKLFQDLEEKSGEDSLVSTDCLAVLFSFCLRFHHV